MEKGSIMFEELDSSMLSHMFAFSNNAQGLLVNYGPESVPKKIEPMSDVMKLVLRSVRKKSSGMTSLCLVNLIDEMESLISEYVNILNGYIYPVGQEADFTERLHHPFTSKLLGWQNKCQWSMRRGADVEPKYRNIFTHDDAPPKQDPPTTTVVSKGNKKLKVSCDTCHRDEWTSKTDLKQHQLQCQKGASSVLDGSKRTTDSSFECSLEVDNEGATGRVSCKKCGKEVASQAAHKKVCPSRYTCSQCGKLFNYGYSLREHIESIHVGIKHHCEDCGGSFSSKRSLNKHLREKCRREQSIVEWKNKRTYEKIKQEALQEVKELIKVDVSKDASQKDGFIQAQDIKKSP